MAGHELMSRELAKRFFTVAEYHRMGEVGIISPNDRVELLDGKIIKIDPISSLHAACTKRINSLITSLVKDVAIVGVQDPVEISDYSEPEPDISVLKYREDYYAGSHPKSSDILLIVEVADTTVEADRRDKFPKYARAGILEAWLVNLPKDLIEVHTDPVKGIYQNIRIYQRGDTISSQVLPQIKVRVDEILP
jgi:Uma2 family endonuclease